MQTLMLREVLESYLKNIKAKFEDILSIPHEL